MKRVTAFRLKSCAAIICNHTAGFSPGEQGWLSPGHIQAQSQSGPCPLPLHYPSITLTAEEGTSTEWWRLQKDALTGPGGSRHHGNGQTSGFASCMKTATKIKAQKKILAKSLKVKVLICPFQLKAHR